MVRKRPASVDDYNGRSAAADSKPASSQQSSCSGAVPHEHSTAAPTADSQSALQPLQLSLSRLSEAAPPTSMLAENETAMTPAHSTVKASTAGLRRPRAMHLVSLPSPC